MTASIVARGTSSCSKPNRFDSIWVRRKVIPVTLPPGLFKLSTRPSFTEIAADNKDDRNCCSCRLGGEGRGIGYGDQRSRLAIDQVSRERGQPIDLTIGKRYSIETFCPSI